MTNTAIRRILAIIVDYKTRADAEALSIQASSLEHSDFALTVVHVDNGSPTPSSLSVAQAAAGVRFLRLDRNHGYAGAINTAIAALEAKGESYDAYWFLNSDLSVEADSLARLVAVLRAHPRVAAVGPVVFWGDGPRIWGARGVVRPAFGVTAMTDWSEDRPLPRWSYVPGCSLLTRAEAYREAGGMPARYKLYYEEAHYCVQLQKAGWDLWVEPLARVHHRVNSMESGVPARHFAYYFTRNNLLFWNANFGIPWYVQLPRTLAVVAKEVILPLRRARSFSEAADRFKYAAAGILDGVPFLKGKIPYFEARLFDE